LVTELNAEIAGEIYKIVKRLDADYELLAIVGSWRDTPDAQVLALPREWHTMGKVPHRPQRREVQKNLRGNVVLLPRASSLGCSFQGGR
jgi:hypothetical protein